MLTCFLMLGTAPDPVNVPVRRWLVVGFFAIRGLHWLACCPPRRCSPPLEHTGVDEIWAPLNSLIRTDRFGTSVAQAFRVHSDSPRTPR
jgi:hypothetical protein